MRILFLALYIMMLPFIFPIGQAPAQADPCALLDNALKSLMQEKGVLGETDITPEGDTVSIWVVDPESNTRTRLTINRDLQACLRK